MYVDDLAEACIHFLKIKTTETVINIGSSFEMSINNYARYVIKKLKSNLKIKNDRSQPDGVLRKIVDSSLARKYGWVPKYDLDKGFNETLKNLMKNKSFKPYILKILSNKN